MRTLLNADELRLGVARVACEVQARYDGRPLTIVGIMTGSLVFLADLMRLLDLPLSVGVVQARSYRGSATRPGELDKQLDFLPAISGRDVLLVDDIFDTGRTLATILGELGALQPASLRSAVLLRKHGRQEVPGAPDFVAFEIPDEFVVGYGLDYQDGYRHLPFLAALEPADLAEPSA